MKPNLTKQIICMMLALTLMIGLLPITAASPSEITMISAALRDNNVPLSGNEVTAMSYGYLTADSEEYTVPSAKGYWQDADGTVINESYQSTGYCFENGATYSFEATFEAASGYKFADASQIHIVKLSNEFDNYQYNYIGGEVLSVSADGSTATVRYTFTFAKTPSKRIDKVVLNGTGDIVEGGAYTVSLGYHNCSITNQKWSGNIANGTFQLGNCRLTATLAADTGYTFANEVTVDLITNVTGIAYEPSTVTVSNDYKTLTAVYDFAVTAKQEVLSTTVELPYYMTFSPEAGDPIAVIPGAWFTVPENEIYERVPEYGDNYYWYDENGTRLEGQSFEAGKTYYIEIGFRIKEDYQGSYEFGENVACNFSGESFNASGLTSTLSRYNGSRYEISVRCSFTAQFPEGAGKTADNPAVCYSFAEFKAAMENDSIPYVALGSCNDTIPMVAGGTRQVAAILVRGFKTVYLLGDATFTAPAVNEDNYDSYEALMYNTYPYAALRFYGPGRLTYKASATDGKNAVVYNEGGNVYIHDATLVGGYLNLAYGRAIWQQAGELYVYGGRLLGESSFEPIDAVHLAGGKAEIGGGTLSSDCHNGSGEKIAYGLSIGKNATVDLTGGTFWGIQLPTSSTPLANYMDETVYTPYTNGQWFNPQSEYSQEYVTYGKEVAIFRVIKNMDVLLDAPFAGISASSEVYDLPQGCYLHAVHWFEDGNAKESFNFTAGKSYKAELYFIAEDNGRFATPLTSATVNGKAATVTTVGNDAAKSICLTVDFGVCAATVPKVALTVTAPKEGGNPSYSVGCGNSTYYAVGGSSNYKDFRVWEMSSDGYDWWEINETHAFMAGYYYRLSVDIRTAEGYEYPLDGNLDPAVTATMNGHAATVTRTYDQDPSRHITVTYDFGECNDSVIEAIVIEGVSPPIAGEKPKYAASVRGSGYTILSDLNRYEGDYLPGAATPEEERLYYIVNGVSWFDLTASDWVYSNETFLPGHEYQVSVRLETEDGYTFYHNKWNDPLFTATVNGQSAQGNTSGSSGLYEQSISTSFQCRSVATSLVMINDLKTPVAGFTPDFAVTAAHSAYYEPDPNFGFGGVYWYKEDNSLLLPEESFTQGEQYTVEIKLIPKKADGVAMCTFVSPVTAYLNGKKIDAEDVYASSNAVYLSYTFTKGAEPPAPGAFLGGTLTCGNGGTAYLQLIPKGLSEAAYEVVTDGNRYLFSDITAGSYTLKVMKEGHITREFDVTVTASTADYNVAIYQWGDVDLNSSVNTADVTALLQILAGHPAPDYTLPADFDQNGRLSVADAVTLLRRIAE